MTPHTALRLGRYIIILTCLAAVLYALVLHLNDERDAKIQKQARHATRLAPSDIYPINHVPFYPVERVITFTGSSKDEQTLLFKPNTGPLITVKAKPGSRFHVFNATLTVTAFDPNTNIVKLKRVVDR